MKKIVMIVFLCSVIKAEAQTSVFVGVDSLLQKGRYKTALQILDKLPETFTSNVKKASIYSVIDSHKKASLYYEKALQFKNDLTVKTKLGQSYRKQKKLQKAIQVFEEITQQDANNLLVKYQLGKLYLQTKNGKKATKIFRSLIANDPKNANYSYQLGLAYALLKKRNLKINNFLNAFKKDSTHIKAIERLAFDFLLLKDLDSSRIFVKKGMQINPNNIRLNRLKANDLFRNKKFTQALTILQKLDTLQPFELYNKKMLARTYYNLEDYTNAKKYFKSASKLDAEDFKSYTYLGHISFKEKKFSKAMIQYIQATYIGEKRRDEEYYGLGQVYYELKKPEKALENFKKAVQENSKNDKALYQLATLSDDYYKEKKTAYKLYKKYIDRFETKDETRTNFANNRIKEIKKLYFLKGKNLE